MLLTKHPCSFFFSNFKYFITIKTIVSIFIMQAFENTLICASYFPTKSQIIYCFNICYKVYNSNTTPDLNDT